MGIECGMYLPTIDITYHEHRLPPATITILTAHLPLLLLFLREEVLLRRPVALRVSWERHLGCGDVHRPSVPVVTMIFYHKKRKKRNLTAGRSCPKYEGARGGKGRASKIDDLSCRRAVVRAAG